MVADTTTISLAKYYAPQKLLQLIMILVDHAQRQALLDLPNRPQSPLIFPIRMNIGIVPEPENLPPVLTELFQRIQCAIGTTNVEENLHGHTGAEFQVSSFARTTIVYHILACSLKQWSFRFIEADKHWINEKTSVIFSTSAFAKFVESGLYRLTDHVTT